jgi:uncharacterized protein YecE (DUF72 family)
VSVRIGTSGWIYPHWRGRFYPPELRAREWFAFYARTFDTVEVNNSFYRLPSAETFEAWRAQAPPGFHYAVKASRFLTHYKHLKDPQEPLRTFFERAAHLGGTLGPVLYQLPPRWRVNLERLEHFLAALPAGYTHVVELRDETWITEAVFQLLERYRVAHCIHDYYTLRVPLRVTAPPVYVRFHGDVDHAGDYPEARLKTWAKRIAEWQSEGLDVYAYFNNDAAPTQSAPLAAHTLRRLCGLE